jgi:hypothetical protein
LKPARPAACQRANRAGRLPGGLGVARIGQGLEEGAGGVVVERVGPGCEAEVVGGQRGVLPETGPQRLVSAGQQPLAALGTGPVPGPLAQDVDLSFDDAQRLSPQRREAELLHAGTGGVGQGAALLFVVEVVLQQVFEVVVGVADALVAVAEVGVLPQSKLELA